MMIEIMFIFDQKKKGLISPINRLVLSQHPAFAERQIYTVLSSDNDIIKVCILSMLSE